MYYPYEWQPQQQQQHYCGMILQHQQQHHQRMESRNVFSNVLEQAGRYTAQWLWLDLECSGLDPTAPTFGILEIAAAVTDEDLNVVETFHKIVYQPPHVIAAASRWCVEHFGSRSTGGNDLFEQCKASVITEADAGVLLEQFITKHARMRRLKVSEELDEPQSVLKRTLFTQAEFGDVTAAATGDAGPRSDTIAPKRTNTKSKAGGQQHDYYRLMMAGCSVYFDRSVILARFPNLRKYIAHKIIDTTSVLEIARRWRPDVLHALPGAASGHRALPDVLESITLMAWFQRTILYAR